MSFTDPAPPPEPGEGGSLRAKDLKNRVVVLKPTGTGIDPEVVDKKGRPWEWTTCDCWVIDRSGIEHYEPDLRISWWRCREQLKEAAGSFVAGKVTEQEDNSIILTPLTGQARKVVESVMDDITAWGQDESAVRDDPDAEF